MKGVGHMATQSFLTQFNINSREKACKVANVLKNEDKKEIKLNEKVSYPDKDEIRKMFAFSENE